MKKKLLFALFIFASMFMTGNNVYATTGDEFTVDGIKYKVISENPNTVQIDKNSSCSGDIVIPSKVSYDNVDYDVTEIRKNAFYGNKNIVSIKLPNSIKTISNSAFSVSSLKSIVIPDSVETIEDFAFQLADLEEVTFGANLKRIGCAAFGATRLKSIVIPGKVTSIDVSAFDTINDLTSIIIPNTVETIGTAAFRNAAESGTVYVLGGPDDTFNNKLVAAGLPSGWNITTGYAVTFKDGNKVLSTQYVSQGSKAVKPTNPTKDGYVFDNWINENGLTINSAITADAVFTASWLRKFNINSGADQTFYLDSDKDIVIVSEGPLSDFLGFGIFYDDNNGYIPMSELTEGTDYVIEEGSTKLILKNSFLKTLAAKEYTIQFYYENHGTYEDGFAATTLLLKATNEQINSNNTTSPDTTNGGITENPKTGDNIIFYISMLALSIIGLTGVGIYTRKRLFNK